MNQRPGRRRVMLRAAVAVVVVLVAGGLAFAWFARDESTSHALIAEEGMAARHCIRIGSRSSAARLDVGR